MVGKRGSGMRTNDNEWLVLTESTKEGDDWIHSCGEVIRGKVVLLSQRDGVGPLTGDGSTRPLTVPFCPKCEWEPKGGTYGHGGTYIRS